MIDPAVEEKVEKELLKFVINVLQNNETTFESAQQLVKEYLALSPFTDMNDLQNKIKTFTDTRPELKPMYLLLLSHEETTKTDNLLNRMRGLIKENKLDEALQVAATK